MEATYTVGQYLVDRLKQLGLEHLFSIAGDYSIQWLTKYVEGSGIAVIQEVNELNAGYAADGYARLRGIGALCTTYSAGALCAANAVAGAFVEKVPLVLINGTPSTARMLTYEQTGFVSHHIINGSQTNLQVFLPISAAREQIADAAKAPYQIDSVLWTCINERRPVYIELLEDVVDQPCSPPIGILCRAPRISHPDNFKDAIQIITQALAQAKKPILWIGVEVDRFGLQDKVEKLLKQLNVLYITQLMSKAVLSEDGGLFAGVFDGRSSSGVVQDLVKGSDFVLALGVWLSDINSLGWPIDYGKTALISWDTVKYGTYFSAQVALEHVIDALLAQVTPREAMDLPQQGSTAKPAVGPGGKISYQGFYDFIQPHIDDNIIVGADASLNYFGCIGLKVPAKGGFIAQSSYSAIGYIAPAATGVSLAKRPEQRVMVFSGDGGFQMVAQCLSTQARFKLNPIIFVIDNGVYGVEQWLANARPLRGDGPFYKECILHRWNYSLLASVFTNDDGECRGWKVETYEQLEKALAAALKNLNGPSIIQVVVPSEDAPESSGWKDKGA